VIEGRVRIERTKMLEMNPETEPARPQANRASGQTLRLLVALSLLLVALAIVVVNGREFWFGSDEASESSAGPESVPDSAVAPATTAQAPATPTAAVTNHVAPKTSTHSVTDSSPSRKDAAKAVSSNSTSPVVAANRVVLPPLDVEVVAGDTHRTVHAGSNIAKVELHGDSNRTSAAPTSVTLATNAAEHGRLSSKGVPELRQTVDAAYPMLAQHMRVQGSVVLQAVVAADGTIENLRVLSGPAILASAAQQAVRQWHFKPYLENGQPVETKARITVNFSIGVSDSAKTS
jgi:TonB family protein